MSEGSKTSTSGAVASMESHAPCQSLVVGVTVAFFCFQGVVQERQRDHSVQFFNTAAYHAEAVFFYAIRNKCTDLAANLDHDST